MTGKAPFAVVTPALYEHFLKQTDFTDEAGFTLTMKGMTTDMIEKKRKGYSQKTRTYRLAENSETKKPLDLVQKKGKKPVLPHECVRAVVAFEFPRFLFLHAQNQGSMEKYAFVKAFGLHLDIS